MLPQTHLKWSRNYLISIISRFLITFFYFRFMVCNWYPFSVTIFLCKVSWSRYLHLHFSFCFLRLLEMNFRTIFSVYFPLQQLLLLIYPPEFVTVLSLTMKAMNTWKFINCFFLLLCKHISRWRFFFWHFPPAFYVVSSLVMHTEHLRFKNSIWCK